MEIGASIVKQLADLVRTRLVPQSINGISRALPKWLKYFYGTLISTSSIPSFSALPTIFVLTLNETVLLSSTGKSAIVPLSSKKGLPL